MNRSFDSWSPLFSSIVVSSVWGLDPEVKVVWITLLALKDRKGFVSGSVPGLARLAVVSVEECERALKIFEAPDPYSKTSENEGRRIRTVDGGWYVLGHQKFQEHMHKVTEKVNGAKRQRQFRERVKAGKQKAPFLTPAGRQGPGLATPALKEPRLSSLEV